MPSVLIAINAIRSARLLDDQRPLSALTISAMRGEYIQYSLVEWYKEGEKISVTGIIEQRKRSPR